MEKYIIARERNRREQLYRNRQELLHQQNIREGGQEAVRNIRDDRQNVHDTHVNDISANIYKKLNTPTLQEINNGMIDMYNEFRLNAKIIKVLDLIQQRNRDGNKISKIQKSELECLVAVWLKVKNNNDKKQYFIQMLEECLVDRNHIYCQIGVVNRLVTALVIDNPDAIPKNLKNELNYELQNLAIRVRKEVMADTTLTTDEQKTDAYKKILFDTARKDYAYLNDGNMLLEALRPLTEACC
jgi:hypothetical protein